MRCFSTVLASQYTAQVLSPKVCWQAVVYYIPKILEAAGVEGDDAQLQLTILIGVCRTAFIAIGCYSVDRLGRRPLLVGSCAGISLALFLLSFGIATDAGTVVAIGVSAALALAVFLTLTRRRPVSLHGLLRCWCWTCQHGSPLRDLSVSSSGNCNGFRALPEPSCEWNCRKYVPFNLHCAHGCRRLLRFRMRRNCFIPFRAEIRARD